MTTPFIMISLLMIPSAVFKLLEVIGFRKLDLRTGAVLGLALLFMFTGVGHFIKTDGMIAMIPDFIPGRAFLVISTGILEFVLAIALVLPQTRRAAGISAMVLLVLFLPVNVSAALREVPMGGHAWGPVYLLIRVPLQLLILYWAYRFAVRKPGSTA